jgi:hypothetical protein
MIDEFEQLVRDTISDMTELRRDGLFEEADELCEELSNTLERCYGMLTEYLEVSIARNKGQMAMLETLRDQMDESVSMSEAISTALH